MFNCPQWGIGVKKIQVTELSTPALNVDPNITSCNSQLMRLCLPVRPYIQVITLRFYPSPGSNWVHLAEVTFWNDNPICPPDIVITSQSQQSPTSPVSTSQVSEPTTQSNTLPHTTSPNTILTSGTAMKPRLVDTTLIAVVIVVVFLLLLLLVGVVVVVLVLCRCRHHHTAKEEASHTSSQTQPSRHQTINLQEIGHTHEEHTQVNDGVVSGSSVDEPEYSVIATKLPSPDSHEPIESGTSPYHYNDKVDEMREKRAKTPSDTGVVQFTKSMTKGKNQGEHKPSSPKTTRLDI